jgi:hypothetical protein
MSLLLGDGFDPHRPHHPSDGEGLNKNTRGQKGANRVDDPVRALAFGGASDNQILQNVVDNRRKDISGG